MRSADATPRSSGCRRADSREGRVRWDWLAGSLASLAILGCSLIDAASPEEARLFLENQKLRGEATALSTENASLRAELAFLSSEEFPIFLWALKAKRAGDCPTALARFDGFLARFPASDVASIAEQEAFECRVKTAEAASAEREQYEAFLRAVDGMPTLPERVKALREWLDRSPGSPHATDVKGRIETLEKQIEVQERFLRPP